MASACNFLAPNDEPSDLAAALEQQYGSAETTKMMTVLRSAEALKVFDWVNNTQYNTDKQELTPAVAKSLYDAVTTGSKFQPNAVGGPETFTNHSGGAAGGDTAWDIIGRDFGVVDHKHYREPAERRRQKLRDIAKSKDKTYSEDWIEKTIQGVDSKELTAAGVSATMISEEDYQEGKIKATAAVKQLGRELSASTLTRYSQWDKFLSPGRRIPKAMWPRVTKLPEVLDTLCRWLSTRASRCTCSIRTRMHGSPGMELNSHLPRSLHLHRTLPALVPES
jgi:tellurite resistance protein